MFKSRSAISLLVVLFFGFAIGVGSTVYADRHMDALSSSLPVDEVRQLAQVIDRIKRAYVDEVDDRELIRNAIDGILSGLDVHSSFLDQQGFSDLQESTSGRFGGLGIEVQMEGGYVKVVSPIDETPAYRAGVQPGDLISHLDGEPVQGMSLNEAVEIMRGEPGTEITLTIIRGGDNTLEVTIERAIIQVTSIRSRMLEPGYGLVRISSFQQNTGRDLQAEIEKLREESEGDLRGLVLDLRNNPGGLLSASVDVSDVFLSDKLVVYTESRLPESAHRYHARRATAEPDIPVVVLVNGGSASASEIVAGALQDHERAIIMGTQSFGKGSVHTVLPMEGNTALKLTTARYFTPSGQNIEATGITPNLIVEPARLALDDMPIERDRELEEHLETLAEPVEERVDPEADEEELINQDIQLYEALNYLKRGGAPGE